MPVKTQLKYSVVVPVFRGTKSLYIVIEKLLTQRQFELSEIVFVFDCGTIEAWQTIKNIAKKNPLVKGIKLSRNYGQHNATICGFQFATGDFIITMDEDLQHNPDLIPTLIAKQIQKDSDLVYGLFKELNHSTLRNITSVLMKKLLRWGIPELHPDYTSFRLIRSEVAKQTLEMRNSYTFLDGYLTWITQNVSSVEIKHEESKEGESSYTIKKLIEHSINIFVTFSNLPIRLLTTFSLPLFLFSFSYAIYIVISALTISTYDAGFPTVVALLGFGFGFVLLGLGIIGEYIQRINLKTTNRPNYIIREIIQ